MKLKPSLFSAILLLASLTLQLLPSCTTSPDRSRLEHIEATIDEHPDSAMALLDSIDGGILSEADRHYFDFLTIKARDKAYMRHTSDSLILDVIDYYSSHETEQMLPWTLYYGGRVHSDLGDYPSAIRYFQDALDLLPPDTKERNLRANLLSQTGRLLSTLRLYNDAEPYLLEVIKIEEEDCDTLNWVYDLQLLGNLLLKEKQYDKADSCASKALALSTNLTLSDKADSKVLLAAIRYHKGDIPSALNLIRHTPEESDPRFMNTALGYAALIYQKAGIADSAYNYAHTLVHRLEPTNKKIGYTVLLSPEYQNIIGTDTLNKYITDYKSILETFFDENSARQAVFQHSMLNYRLHDRQRQKTEHQKDMMQKFIQIGMIVLLSLVIIILYLRNRNHKTLIRLQEELYNVDQLKKIIENNNKRINPDVTPSSNTSEDIKENLREQLREKLLSLYNTSQQHKEINPDILSSNAYHRLREMIFNNETIKDNDEIWNELESVIIHLSPTFKSNLILLTGGRVSKEEFRTALLIKCGIKPVQISILLGRGRGTIVSRREDICRKIFDEKLGAKIADGIIRLL